MKDDFKKCTKCGEEKPATAEYFHRNKRANRDKRAKSGLVSQCKDCRAASHKKYREKNPEKCRAAIYSWCKANPEKKSASDYKYKKKRRKEDPVFRLNCYMRSGLGSCLSGRRKNSHTFDYIGLTPKELMDYFEGQFTEGMTRENYGEWHVDHIRPLASFDFTGPDREEQLHAAWSYTNMQPLWAVDNIRKGARYEEGSLL